MICCADGSASESENAQGNASGEASNSERNAKDETGTTTKPRKGGEDLNICLLDDGYKLLKKPRILFVFSGQATQYPQMGVGLYKHDAVFRACMDRCCSLVNSWDPDIDVMEELRKEGGQSKVYSAPLSMVLIPAVQIALVNMLRSKGVEPAGTATEGHHQGVFECF